MSDGKTKVVNVRLAALTRVEWNAQVEVPWGVTRAQLDALVDEFYAKINGGDYQEDEHFWERVGHEDGWSMANQSGQAPEYRARQGENGEWVIEEVEGDG